MHASCQCYGRERHRDGTVVSSNPTIPTSQADLSFRKADCLLPPALLRWQTSQVIHDELSPGYGASNRRDFHFTDMAHCSLSRDLCKHKSGDGKKLHKMSRVCIAPTDHHSLCSGHLGGQLARHRIHELSSWIPSGISQKSMSTGTAWYMHRASQEKESVD